MKFYSSSFLQYFYIPRDICCSYEEYIYFDNETADKAHSYKMKETEILYAKEKYF